MKLLVLSMVLAAFASPMLGFAAETAFFSTPGKYTLSSEDTLTISLDDTSRLPKATINYASGGGNGVGLGTRQTANPFLAYWDAATQTLWWGTVQNVGYLDVHVLRSARSGFYPRGVPIHDGSQALTIPTVFTTELDRTIPQRP